MDEGWDSAAHDDETRREKKKKLQPALASRSAYLLPREQTVSDKADKFIRVFCESTAAEPPCLCCLDVGR